MANTTDLSIVTFGDCDAITKLNEFTGCDFKKYSKSYWCGGIKDVCFDIWGYCPRCLSEEQLKFLIKIFLETPFSSSEYATLFVCCDNNEHLDGTYSSLRN